MLTRDDNDAILPVYQPVETQSISIPMKDNKEVQTCIDSEHWKNVDDLNQIFNQKLLVEKRQQQVEYVQILSKLRVENVKALCERDEALAKVELITAKCDLLTLNESIRLKRIKEDHKNVNNNIES
ncbi:hypothetical protein I4U23_000371 [Adineta vaga]|nr:hypothetical protein I4U23_000371 [Adineta vaga]